MYIEVFGNILAVDNGVYTCTCIYAYCDEVMSKHPRLILPVLPGSIIFQKLPRETLKYNLVLIF